MIRFLVVFIIFTKACDAKAQLTALQVQEFVTADQKLKSLGLGYPSLVAKFYQHCKFEPAWIGAEHLEQRQTFFAALDQSSGLGLSIEDYHFSFLQSLKQEAIFLKTSDDSVAADLRVTDAAIHFYGEVKKGNRAPLLKYNGLKYQPGFEPMPALLAKYISSNTLKSLISDLEPDSKEYANIKKKLIHFNRVISAPGFMEIKIKSKKADSANTALVLRLYQLGLLDSLDETLTNRQLMQRLQAAQKMLGLLNDGVLRSTTIEALNVSLIKRRREVELALNYLRWLNEIRENDNVVFLNIPSATLFTYMAGELVLESRVIAGKPSTPTPTLSSRITEVILYPYWNVPPKIATKELLPHIKRNIGYLEANNFQVLNKQGNILDPYTIDWSSLSTGYFPYLIRQSTGCDNSLGIVKLNFYNPFTVYLHDTPGKGLFFFNKRYYSHGCMRVEGALELARLVAKDHVFTINKIAELGCAPDQPPIVISADVPLNLFVLYSTAWYDTAGSLIFCDDVYNHN